MVRSLHLFVDFRVRQGHVVFGLDAGWLDLFRLFRVGVELSDRLAYARHSRHTTTCCAHKKESRVILVGTKITTVHLLVLYKILASLVFTVSIV